MSKRKPLLPPTPEELERQARDCDEAFKAFTGRNYSKKDMTPQERYKAIVERAQAETNALVAEVFASRQYTDGTTLRRVRYNPDGTLLDEITAVVVGANAYLYGDKDEEYPRVQYWTRVLTPLDYNSRQRCLRFGLELGKAEDFWEGDERWSKLL